MHCSSSFIAKASTASRENRSPKSTPRSSSSRLTGCRASASTSWSRSMREVRNASGASPARTSSSADSWSGQDLRVTSRVVEVALKESTTSWKAATSSSVP
jgi:hypothetical protein